MPRPSVHPGFSETLVAAILAVAAAIAMAFALLSDAKGANLIGDYDLSTGSGITITNQSTETGALGNMTVTGNATSTFNGTGWHWSGATTPGIGLSVGVPPSFGNYTIGLRFSLGDLTDYRRLVLFNDTSDLGMYVYPNLFSAYDGSYHDSDPNTFFANTTVDFVLTRSSSGNQTTGYIINYSGPNPVSSTELFTFADSSQSFVSTGNVTRFFRDNNGGGEYSSNGTASLIRIWDAPLTAGEITYSMVPEPTTVALLVVAGGSVGLYLHRRRRRLR